ncbi:MAG: NUDIX domain-containing protein [Thioalkalispiraceae bacterium]|jgi:predicted NUDIX family NTP pyrophosphohydrolase
MGLQSAGILCYRYHDNVLEVFLVHPGGPFWVNRDAGAWSIPKGLIEAQESPLAAARREFAEETGFEVEGEFIGLGQLKQPSNKIVHAWAIEQDIDATQIRSNTFSLEWPKHSGNICDYPEVDQGAWFRLDEAKHKITKGQCSFLDRLLAKLA